MHSKIQYSRLIRVSSDPNWTRQLDKEEVDAGGKNLKRRPSIDSNALFHALQSARERVAKKELEGVLNKEKEMKNPSAINHPSTS
mmetsp:Transcript_22151/g.72919  ORF Transcript_22151/g.72919 Transcript_22151/m.72919 type:complete len:85 (+) Transcript_22151:226-480(+)